MIGPFGFEPKKTMRARAFRLARALVQRGHDVALFMPPWHTPKQAGQTWAEDGVLVKYVPLGGGPAAITARLVSSALAWQPDAVHCFKPKAYSGAAASWLWLRHRRSVRVVMDMDDWEGWGGWNDRESYPRVAKHLFARQERLGMRHCHAVTVASRALETLALGHGVSAETLTYLPNGPGIDIPNTPREVTDRPVLLLYTRFFEFDVTRLVEVLCQVQAQVPDVTIRLVGAGLDAADGAEFRRLMRAHDLAGHIDDVGWLPEDALPTVLRSAEIGLYLMDDTLLNRTKCPVKLADMAALGLPVVGEAVGQVPEYVVHGQTGLLSSPGNVAGMVHDILRLLRDRTLRDRLGDAARAHIAARFGWDIAAKSAEIGYTRAI